MKAESDAKMWKTRYEAEAVSRIEELEEENNKLREGIQIIFEYKILDWSIETEVES